MLQLLVSLRQYYPKRHWLREMLTDLEISLSYHLEERALLVGQILGLEKGLKFEEV